MGVFKNDVGRPSNKVLRIRRVLLGSFVAMLVGVFVMETNNLNSKNNSENLKGASLKLVDADTSGIYFESQQVYTGENNVRVADTYYIIGDLYNSKDKKIGSDGVINLDDASYLEKNLDKISRSNDSLTSKLADVNHDKKINKNDVNLIKRMASNQKKVFGDLDGDSIVTYKDKNLMYKYLNAKSILKSSQRKLADIDGNGIVTKTDYKLMLYKPAYEYCVTKDSKIEKAKTNCTWYNADNIKVDWKNNKLDYYLYMKDLSNNQISEKGLIVRKYSSGFKLSDVRDDLSNFVNNFNSGYFGGARGVNKTQFLAETVSNSEIVFKDYYTKQDHVAYSFGEDFKRIVQLVDTKNNTVIYDSTKQDEFTLKIGKIYYLKMKCEYKSEDGNNKYESKVVPIRLVKDSKYVKNVIVGKKTEILFLLESYSSNSLTLSNNVIYQSDSLLQTRDTINTIVIPSGFDFSNLEFGSLVVSDYSTNFNLKIINKTSKSADWYILTGGRYANIHNTTECIFKTGKCNFSRNASINVIVTSK